MSKSGLIHLAGYEFSEEEVKALLMVSNALGRSLDITVGELVAAAKNLTNGIKITDGCTIVSSDDPRICAKYVCGTCGASALFPGDVPHSDDCTGDDCTEGKTWVVVFGQERTKGECEKPTNFRTGMQSENQRRQ